MAPSELNNLILITVISQLIILPCLGIVYFGIRRENDRKARLMGEALKALQIIAVSKGKHL